MRLGDMAVTPEIPKWFHSELYIMFFFGILFFLVGFVALPTLLVYVPALLIRRNCFISVTCSSCRYSLRFSR